MLSTTILINQKDLLQQLEQLIKACISGDRNSQSNLYEQLAPKMLGVCMRYAKNKEEAEETMQEGFIQVFRSLKNFKYAGSFEGWVRKIMVYSAIHQHRTKPKTIPVVLLENMQNEYASGEETLARIHKKELLVMTQTLPPGYRMIFNLYVFEVMKLRNCVITRHLRGNLQIKFLRRQVASSKSSEKQLKNCQKLLIWMKIYMTLKNYFFTTWTTMKSIPQNTLGKPLI